MGLDRVEKSYFLKLFNRMGYVLDFNNNSFDLFTLQSVGIEIRVYYRLSKGKSLSNYIDDESFSEKDKEKLLFDLLVHYENSPIYERECGEYSDEESEYKLLYKKCREIANRELLIAAPGLSILDDVSKDINSDYIESQINIIKNSIEDNPTIAIGKCKELVETICIYILESYNLLPDPVPDFPKLVRETMRELDIMPENISDTITEKQTIKVLLNNLASISNSLAELRNNYGDGHGKKPSYVGLQPRHAKLALGASSTLVLFLWETYKLKKK